MPRGGRTRTTRFGLAIFACLFGTGGDFVRGELVAHWSLDGTLANLVEPVPRAAYFLLDDGAPTPALETPEFVPGPPALNGGQAIALSGPSDPGGGDTGDGYFLTAYEDELGLAPVGETFDWALTGWFRIDASPSFGLAAGKSGQAGLFLNGLVESGQQQQLGLRLAETETSQFELQYAAGGQGDLPTSFVTLTEEVWYFVAQVSNAADNQLTVYLWDERQATRDLAAEVVQSATPLRLERVFEFEMGWDPCCRDQLFDGALADIRIHNEALTLDELQRIAFPDPRLRGDLNHNDTLDAPDIDLLSAAVRDGDTSPRYDLNLDGQVDDLDRVNWVEELRATWFGDANLDGEFDSGDFVHVFQLGEYEDGVPLNSSWETGDWNGDGDFESADFVIAFQRGGYELGPRSEIASVPEPQAPLWLPIVALAASGRYRKIATSAHRIVNHNR